MRFVKTAENLFGLPSGFTRVEYLESNSTAYIDTGVSGANDNLKIEMGFSYSKFYAYGYLFSNYESETANVTRFCLNGTDTNWGLAYINTKSQNGAIYTSNFTKDSFHTFVLTKTSVTIDGNTTTNNNPPSGTENTKNIILFNRGAGTYYEKRDVGMRCYYFRIYDNDTLVRDFIPCIDPLGRPCLYDLVGKKAYYNQGTGEFTVGRQIIPVEYLEGTGTQYIDTGLKGKNGYDFDYKVNFTQLGGSLTNAVGGEWETNKSCYFGMVRTTEKFAYHYQGTSSAIEIQTMDIDTDYRIQAHLYSGEQYYIINGTKSAVGTITGTFTSTNNMRLFSIYSGSPLYSHLKMYFCKVWDNNSLVRDFIPCKDENDVGFMFDTVSGTVYENAGTGAFTVGQNKYKMKLRLIKDNILPTGYTQLEYIEAENSGMTEVQYAVGNYRLTNTTDWEITFSAENSNNSWVLGQPTWIGVHYRKDTTTGNLPRVGITNGSTAGTQRYVDYTDNEKITLALKGTDVYANGVKVGSITRASAGATQTKYGIFAYKDINQDLPNLRIQSARIYRLKIWDNGVLVQDLIPAMKNGVAGFYERVTKTFIEKESNSTSDFTTGKPVLPVVRFPVDPVPAGYKAVNYLESTGTQYIDTGYLANSNTKVDIGFTLSEHQNDVLFGGRTTSEVLSFFVWAEVKILNCCRYDYTFQGANNRNGGLVSLNTYSNIIKDKEKNYLNGTQYSSNTIHTFATTKNAYLFAGNNDGTADFFHKGKIYYAKLWDNGMLVRNFIPVVRLLDNKAGMWDTVTKQFYTTPTGDFITG